jgi:hypothetical protein
MSEEEKTKYDRSYFKYQTVRFILQVEMTEKMTYLIVDNQEFISVVC